MQFEHLHPVDQINLMMGRIYDYDMTIPSRGEAQGYLLQAGVVLGGDIHGINKARPIRHNNDREWD
ncbi:hypothetical protein [Paenibacillus sp. L3-i20]|uniref:hypothetical protein n=1 Tax=Paenibacillus sp. L3-i20 TaxID=2905833 RepID=UPI001EDCD6AE|nr:hypothetical protein [Paenibacillus sp. L3-i20]GKU76594.1 hypothetical protein L3i20_v209910 [Paenibacillus sp. L3-i20]